jgi:hypothetical protein
MTVVLTTRTDIDLDCFRRVAWQSEAVRISEAALQRIANAGSPSCNSSTGTPISSSMASPPPWASWRAGV